jgi:hypothetical protein
MPAAILQGLGNRGVVAAVAVNSDVMVRLATGFRPVTESFGVVDGTLLEVADVDRGVARNSDIAPPGLRPQRVIPGVAPGRVREDRFGIFGDVSGVAESYALSMGIALPFLPARLALTVYARFQIIWHQIARGPIETVVSKLLGRHF